MKKIIITLFVLIGLTVGAKAQDTKYWVGGTFNLSTSKVKDADISTTNFTLAPEFGVKLSDQWGIGVAIGFTHQYGSFDFDELDLDDLDLDGGLKVNTFSISPFARYTYFQRDIASLFVDGGFKFATSHVVGADDNLNTLKIGFRPGVAFNIAPNLQLIGKIGFLGYQMDKFADATTNSFGINFDLSEVQLGVNFQF